MEKREYEPQFTLGGRISNLERKTLCELCCELCRQIRDEVGTDGYRGGIYPDNISLDDSEGVGLGTAKDGDWEGQELDFLAPEIYWNGDRSPKADVYSLGMLLYYGINSAQLPFHKSGADKARERRLNGERFAPPKAAGRRLGEIITKATSFKPSERYSDVTELQAMLESIISNHYLSGAPSAETVFQKSEEELSQVERMMVSILSREDSSEEIALEDEPDTESEDIAPEETAAAESELPDEEDGDAADDTAGAESEESDQAEPSESKAFDIELPFPEREPEREFHVEIPVLTEEKNPELAPVRVKSAKQKKRERQRAIRRRARRRKRRFLFFVAALCVLVILVAVVWGRMNPTELSFSQPTPAPTPTVEPTRAPITVISTPEPAPTAEPTPEPVREHRYEIVRDNVSWTRAAEICRQMGGYLVTINDQAEFDRVVEMAASSNTPNIWIGCHRENGALVWESGESVSFYRWDEANGEPSGWDSYDNIPEDYVMLWYHNGWFYNDNRNDPAGDYPAIYGGAIGFVCEYENN